MATLLEQIKNLEKLNEKAIVEQIFKALKLAEKRVLDSNKQQLGKGDNADGENVGVYAKATKVFADFDNIDERKTEGTPYNFEWTGEFLKGFTLSVTSDEAVISSSGIGSGGKRTFLTTNNLFGLTDENLKTVIQKDILPFIHEFSRKTLNI